MQRDRKTKPIFVMKFGGTSVGSADIILQTAGIIRTYAQENLRLVVVVSALKGITNHLIKSAMEAGAGKTEAFHSRIKAIQGAHSTAIESLGLSEERRASLSVEIQKFIDRLTNYCRSIEVLGEVTPRGMDAISSLGERMSARIVSALLSDMGIASMPLDADRLIVTDSAFQNATPLREETLQKSNGMLIPLLNQGIIPVVTGYIGATHDGITTTLGRGGSDYTAAILGNVLDAQEVWIWTDVDGVMTADPSIVHDAQVIQELTYDEVSEMAYFGAKVLHPKTMRPLMEKDIPIRVKNTFNPQSKGTCISSTTVQRPGKVSCVTAIRDVCLLTVRGKGMLGVPGVAARTFSAVAAENASVLMISQSSSEQSICFVIPKNDVERVIRSLQKELAFEISRGDIDSVSAMEDVVIVTAIGAGMRHTPGVSARIFEALGSRRINVIAIAQGSSEYSISMVISASEADEAVRRIHQEVIINGNQ